MARLLRGSKMVGEAWMARAAEEHRETGMSLSNPHGPSTSKEKTNANDARQRQLTDVFQENLVELRCCAPVFSTGQTACQNRAAHLASVATHKVPFERLLLVWPQLDACLVRHNLAVQALEAEVFAVGVHRCCRHAVHAWVRNHFHLNKMTSCDIILLQPAGFAQV